MLACAAGCANVAMGHNLWLHFGVDEHPFATYFDVHQGYRVFDPQPCLAHFARTCFQFIELMKPAGWFNFKACFRSPVSG